ncbi:MAG: acyl-CoA dehydratase activase [Syntrophales bacterium]|nr:acyl-CoA dehydratase activase [Syntrophales bacterium]
MGNSVDLYVGIDIGSVSINLVVINDREDLVYERPYERHFGKVEEKCTEALFDVLNRFGYERVRSVSFTGSHGRKIAERLGLFYEFESITQVMGTLKVYPNARSIICMGGQDTSFFQIAHHYEGEWSIEHFSTNGPCAAGTGSFIDQQAERLSIAMYEREAVREVHEIDKILKDFITLGMKSNSPACVACRCTVFTKSDMIHLQNKGEKLEDIIYGLHVGNARNYISTIIGNRMVAEPVIFIGGLSLNALQVRAFREYFTELVIPPLSTSLGALGVAILALRAGDNRIVKPEDIGTTSDLSTSGTLPVGERLILEKTVFQDSGFPEPVETDGKIRVYLGIDVGSTTTKYALVDERGRIIGKRYVTTRGRPIEVTQELLKNICETFGDRLEILGVATTGSGRHVVGDFLNADLMVDEITAHARGAVEIDGDVDTVFEIGGQDSKYIYIHNRNPLDFDMNKVCAAGTGSFLHELASKYGVNIVGEFQDIAMSAEHPIKLTERCTVFMESDLLSYHQRGACRNDLLAGLCYAIVHNYLNRVVGKRKIGKRIMFLGGPSLNKGVVAAFEKVLGVGIVVPPHREVLGAYGAALFVKEYMEHRPSVRSRFRSVKSVINDKLDYVERVCRADANCHNQCKLKIYDFDGRKSIWGGECGRYEILKSVERVAKNYFKVREEILHSFIGDLDSFSVKEGKVLSPVVGLARCLHFFQTAVFWVYFFNELGMNVVLTPPTDTRIAERGIELTLAETCFPVKLSYGHFELLKGKVDYFFAPHMIDMPVANPGEVGLYCPLVQASPSMINAVLQMDNFLDPVVRLNQEPEIVAHDLYVQLKGKLSIKFKKEDVRRAVVIGLEKHRDFQNKLIGIGQEVLNGIDDRGWMVVVTGRPYNLYDERINLRLGYHLSRLGITALPMDFLDVRGVDLSDFPSMYWGLGATILKVAKFIKNHPRLFGIHITNFSCGPDSFLEHFYRYVMGDKPYLILEMDEHTAVAGMMTRIEAFRNVIENVVNT